MNKDLAWAAGLFEGEGSVYTQNDHQKRGIKTYKYQYPRLELVMTDRDVVVRFAKIMGGKVAGPYSRAPHKATYRWKSSTKSETLTLAKRLYPLMGERRSQQFRKVFGEQVHG